MRVNYAESNFQNIKSCIRKDLLKNKITLLVLAAGMGSRFGGLKQLTPFGPGGETLMDYSVYDAIRAGFDRIVFVIRRDFEAVFREQVGSRYAGKIDIEYAFQSLDDLPGGKTPPEGREKPWGTGQAVYAARNVIDGPFAVINADDFYGAESFRKLAEELRNFTPGKLGMCLCGYRLENTLSEHGSVSRGICETKNGCLTCVTEHTRLTRDGKQIKSELENGDTAWFPPDQLVSMNCWGFSPELFAELETMFTNFLNARGQELKSEFYIPFAADELIRAGKVRCRMLTSDDRWFGVTYQDDRPAVVAGLAALAASGQYPAQLFQN